MLEQAFSTCYFLMKEHMPDRKFIPLLEMIESQIFVSELKHFSHRSKGYVQDIFACFGNTVKEALLEEVIKAISFGLLIDEATDIATCSQLISFVQYVNSSGNTEVKFLGIKMLYKHLMAAMQLS